jgi:hypothetical protein
MSALAFSPIRLAGLLGVLAIAVVSLAGISLERGLNLDFANFYVAGQKALHGQIADLYDERALVAGAAPIGRMPFFSLPVASYLFAPLALLAPKTAFLLFKTLAVLCTWAGLWLLYRHVRRFARPDDPALLALFAFAALAFQPFWTIYLVGGQTMPLIFLLFILGLVWFWQERFGPAAAAYVLIVVIKPLFVLGLALVFLFGGGRFRLWTAGLGGLAAVVSLMAVGWAPHPAFLWQMREAAGPVEKLFVSHMFAWLEPLFLTLDDYEAAVDAPADLRAARLVMRLVVIAAFVWAYMPFFRSDAPAAVKRHVLYVLAMLFPILVAPLFWAYYLMVLFVPLAQMIAARHLFPAAAQVTIGLAAGIGLTHNLLLIQKLEGLIGFDRWTEIFLLALAKSATMALVALVMLIWRRDYLRGHGEGG